jgi:hypothetical protein
LSHIFVTILPCVVCPLQLEEQEALMKEDVLDEVSAYNGRILLHKEIDPQASAPQVFSNH